MTLGLGMWHWGCGAYPVCSYDESKLTLTYLTAFIMSTAQGKAVKGLKAINEVSINSLLHV